MTIPRLKNKIYFVYCMVFFIAAAAPAVMTPFAPGITERETVGSTEPSSNATTEPTSNGVSEPISKSTTEPASNGITESASRGVSEPVSGGDQQQQTSGNQSLNGFFEFWAGFDFDKQFGLRKELIALDSRIKSGIFGESSNEKVVLGKDGWLFLAETLDPSAPANVVQRYAPKKALGVASENATSAASGDTLGDASGNASGNASGAATGAGSGEGAGVAAARIARALALMQEYAEGNGARLLFAPAPNKARVYSEFLPYYAPFPGITGLALYDLTLRNLDRLGVNYINFASHIAELKSENPYVAYYHKTDTHWNNLYSAYVYRLMMAEFKDMLASEPPNMNHGPYEHSSAKQPSGTPAELEYDTYEAIIPREVNDWRGDLDSMLDPLTEKTDIQYYYEIEKIYRSRKPVTNPEEINITTTSNKNSLRVLFMRDSFFNSLIQFFSNNLGEATYSRSMPFPLSRAEDGAYDFVVVEIAERNMHWIVDAAPDVPAPFRAHYSTGGDEIKTTAEWAKIISQISEGAGLANAGDLIAILPFISGTQQLPAEAVTAIWLDNIIGGKLNSGVNNDGEQNSSVNSDGAQNSGVSSNETQYSNGKVAGYFDPAFFPADSELRIFPLFMATDGDVYITEAFPILEKAVRGTLIAEANVQAKKEMRRWDDCGFSFRLGGSNLPQGEYIIMVLIIHEDTGQSFISEQLLKYENIYE